MWFDLGQLPPNHGRVGVRDPLGVKLAFANARETDPCSGPALDEQQFGVSRAQARCRWCGAAARLRGPLY